jgi:hypothetical protein
LTVSQGTIVLDDGTGNTTSLVLQAVTVNNTGNLVFQRGGNRNLALTTGAFTVNTVAPALPTVVMDTSYGVLSWTINGNMTLNGDFNAINGANYMTGADIRIQVTGNFIFNGGNVALVNKADAPLRFLISGNTSINNLNGTGGLCFIEGGNGALTYSTTDFNFSNGINNYLLGKPTSGIQYKGVGTFTITNDLNANGSGELYFAYADSNANKIRIAVTRDFNSSGTGLINGAYTLGGFTFKAGRNVNFTAGKFSGQNFFGSTVVDSIIVGTSFIFNSPNSSDYFKANRGSGNTIVTCPSFSILNSGLGYGQGVALVDSGASNLSVITSSYSQSGGQFVGILSGSGNLTFNCSGAMVINAGIFKGNSNTIYSNAGGLTFTAGSIEFNGGYFSAYYNSNNAGGTGTVTINGSCTINFTSVSDEFNFIGLPVTGFDINNLSLNLNLTGSLAISGVNGKFVSSRSLGSETVSMSALTVSGGNNSFNCEPNSVIPNGHNVTILVTGNISISGGSTYLSAFSQTLTTIVNGNVSITGGSLTVKGADCTTSTMNILGGFSMSNGDFYLHNNVTDELPASGTITVNVNSNDDNNGDFIQTGGTITFDNCATTPAALNLILNIKSPNYTLGGTGAMTMTKPGIGIVYGSLNFARNGVINFNRSGNHLIQQVKQTINASCTLDMISGDLQIASNNSISTPPEFLWVNVGAVLNAHNLKIFSNALKTNSGITVLGRVKTSNTNGLYDGTTNATFSTTIADNLDYYLATSSTIEYNGTVNQKVTGIGIGKALFSYHKYANLDINVTGVANTDFVYLANAPNDSSVFVRTALILTNGELNLDDDHNAANGGGRILTIESGSILSTQRVNGYIRSETENNSALIKWNIGSVTGIHTIPFGYSSTEYIPFSFQLASGSAPTFYCGTYHTIPINTPFPPTVTHIRNNSGLDNSANTVDRFWFNRIVGSTVYNATLTFNATPTEIGTITALKAQRWVAGVTSWTNPLPGVQNSTATGNSTSGITDITNWWTLSGNNTPLPVELINFEADCIDNEMLLKWTTASELNNDHFLVERSINGIDFTLAGKVSGNGTSSVEHHYQLKDNFAVNEIVYYRLSQFDFDGQSKVYPTIAAKACQTDEMTALVSNTGAIPNLFVQSPQYSKASIVIYDLSSRVLFKDQIILEKGMNDYRPDLKSLSAGIYFISVQCGETSVTKQFFVN